MICPSRLDLEKSSQFIRETVHFVKPKAFVDRQIFSFDSQSWLRTCCVAVFQPESQRHCLTKTCPLSRTQDNESP